MERRPRSVPRRERTLVVSTKPTPWCRFPFSCVVNSQTTLAGRHRGSGMANPSQCRGAKRPPASAWPATGCFRILPADAVAQHKKVARRFLLLIIHDSSSTFSPIDGYGALRCLVRPLAMMPRHVLWQRRRRTARGPITQTQTDLE